MSKAPEKFNADLFSIRDETEQWRKDLGLGSEDDVPPGHDEAHVLVRHFFGRGFERAPTVLEEIVVECIEEGSRLKDRGVSRSFFQGERNTAYKRNLEEEIRRSLKISRSLGVLPEGFSSVKQETRILGKVLALFRKVAQKEDFYQLLDDVRVMKRLIKVSPKKLQKEKCH